MLRVNRAVEKAENVHDLLRELLDVDLRPGIREGRGGQPVASRRAPDAQVDPAREQRLQHAELLGNFQRRVVGQHDTATPDPNGVGGRGDAPDQDLGARAGERPGIVVLRHPVARVAQPFDDLGQPHRLLQSISGRPSLSDRGLVYNAQGQLIAQTSLPRQIHSTARSRDGR